jgi:non-specific serine/threonine protein kinase
MATGELVFGSFRIDIPEQLLWKGAVRLKITPKSFAVLTYLAQRAGTLVTKEELHGAIWTDTHVGASSLKTCIAEIRRVLGDTAEAPDFIEAVPRRGYRFIALVGVSNLPAPLTSFVGRAGERSGVTHLLDEGRLVTIWGPAGVGKTRLAMEIARDLMPAMPHGVWWVDLSPLFDSNLVGHTVATTLGIPGFLVADTLARALNERQLLLVFDNCEHVRDACASLAIGLLRACPKLKILATSREALGVPGESVWPLSPLPVPDASAHDDDPGAFDGIRLFAERAKDANPFFSIADHAAAVARICRCVDGLPLAIELAAARVKSVTPEQMTARLDDVLRLLAQRGPTDPAHHQTLRAAFDWSYELLSAQERALFASLSVFAGSFTLTAVESVCGDTVHGDAGELFDLMSQLVDRSLVATEPSPEETRYRLLDTVRRYASEKLPAEMQAGLARRHAEFFLRVAEAIEPSIHSVTSAVCLVRLSREHDNFRAALQWSSSSDRGEIGLRLAAALCWFWIRRGQLREGRNWLEAMLERGDAAPPRARAAALDAAGTLALSCGERERARDRLEASVTLWRTTHDLRGLGRALHHLGLTVQELGDVQAAKPVSEESVDVLRRASSPWDLAIALCGLGTVKRLIGQAAEARPLYEESVAILRALGDGWTLKYPLGELAALAASQHRYDLAEAYYRQSLIALRPLEEYWFLSLGIVTMAQVRLALGDHDHAVRLFGAAEGLRQVANLPPLREVLTPEYEQCLNELRASLGGARFDALWEEGRKMSRDEAITLALVPTSTTPEEVGVGDINESPGPT